METKNLRQKLLTFFGYKLSRIDEYTFFNEKFRDPFLVQKHLMGGSEKELVIFDVGAYDGGTAMLYKKLFPKSKIFSFEPFKDSFSILKERVSSFQDIVTINKGLGKYEGSAKFYSNSLAPTNSLLETHELAESVWFEGIYDTIKTLEVELTTLDSFVETHNINKIDILKMDVQGAEYMVMEGAKKTFAKGIVDIIYTEIITLPTYKEQLQFDEILRLMKSYGFELFNVYNDSLTIEGQLRQVDAIFVKSPL